MTTATLAIRPKKDGVTDVGILWQIAVERYEKTTKVKIDALPKANNIEAILREVKTKKSLFEAYRHDGTNLDRFRSFVVKCLQPVQQLGGMVGGAVSSAFPPSSCIFSAVVYFIQTVNSVSGDYDKITEFFQELSLYLSRLKILERNVPLIPELEFALVEVLTSVFVLCGICVKYTKMNRIGTGCFLSSNSIPFEALCIESRNSLSQYLKTLRNLLSGEDQELSEAYTHFRQMVKQEENAVQYASFVAISNLQKETASLHTDVRGNVGAFQRVDQNLKALAVSTNQSREIAESRAAALEKADILAKFSSLDFTLKHRDMLAKHHNGTGEWFLRHPIYQQWFSERKCSTVWCPGIPGAGKTVMMYFTANHVQEAVPKGTAAVVCIYCDYEDPETHSEEALLGSIAMQMLKQIKLMPNEVKYFYDNITEENHHLTGNE